MTARTTMASLIATLRGMTNAGATDYTVGSSSYWTDDQLQTVLDRYCLAVYDELINSAITYESGGLAKYYDYYSKHRYFETTDGGTARFIVKDSNFDASGTANWTADYERGKVSFVADTTGVVYYLTGFSYDLNAAAADVWYQKAAHASEKIDFQTDNHNIKRSHIAAAALAMARRYEGLAGQPGSNYMERGDT